MVAKLARPSNAAITSPQATPDSAAQQIEQGLRRAIVTLELPPGMRLSENEVALRFGFCLIIIIRSVQCIHWSVEFRDFSAIHDKNTIIVRCTWIQSVKMSLR